MATGSKYSIFNRLNPEEIYNQFLGMDQRQQILTVSALIIVLVLMIVVPFGCASAKLSDLEKDYEKSMKSQEKFMSKLETYEKTQGRIQQLRKALSGSSGGRSLSAVVESIANEAEIGSKINRLKPINLGVTEFFDEEGVDAVFTQVSLEEVLNFLQKVEDYQQIPLTIKQLQVKPNYRQRQMLTATIQLSTLKAKIDEPATEVGEGEE